MTMTVDFSPKRPLVTFSTRRFNSRRLALFVAVASSLAFASGAEAQGRPSNPPSRWDDSTGESDVYPVGDAVDVYRSVLDLLYIDGRDRPPYIILVDTASRLAWTPCTDPKCLNRWIPKSDIDSATLRAYSRQSPKRPRIIKFRYSIPIHLVSTGEFERMTNDGYAILAGTPPDKIGGPSVFWAGFLKKYPKAWGYSMFGKVAFNPPRTQAMMSVYQNCGGGCYSIESIFLKRFGKEWRVMERIPYQVEMGQTSGSRRYRGPGGERADQSQFVATDSLGTKPRPMSEDAGQVYATVLDKLYSLYGEFPASIVLNESRGSSWMELPQHRSRIDSSTIASYKVYAQLRDAVRPVFKSALPIKWISDTALKELERAGAPLAAAAIQRMDEQSPLWLAFHQKYPNAWGFTTLSRVGFNTNHTEALIFTRHNCGSTCVNADFWFLERKNDNWYVVERIPAEYEPNQSGQPVPPAWAYSLDGLRYLGPEGDAKWYRPRRVYGVLTDAETGKPLSKVQVEVANQGRSLFIETDDEGRYSANNLQLGGGVLRVKCPPESPTKWALAGVFPVTPGLDSTVNGSVAFAECAQEPLR
jgi:hypothetical protein